MTPKDPCGDVRLVARPTRRLMSPQESYYDSQSSDVNPVVTHQNAASVARHKAIEPTLAEIYDAWLAKFGHLGFDDFGEDGHPIAEGR
jgi:hypothetical protein